VRILALVIGLATAALCARLGVWQLHRLAERRAWNAEVERRLAEPPLVLRSGLTSVVPDSLQYRQVEAAGVFAFGDQRTEPNRSLRGTPGVFVITPLRFSDGTGVLVQRGFTYAPDGMTADLPSLTEPESTVVRGILLAPLGRHAVHPESLAVGYPLFPLMIRRTEPPAGRPERMATIPLPALDEGPHLSYAVQWFAFALIALVGGALLARRGGVRRAVPLDGGPSVD